MGEDKRRGGGNPGRVEQVYKAVIRMASRAEGMTVNDMMGELRMSRSSVARWLARLSSEGVIAKDAIMATARNGADVLAIWRVVKDSKDDS